MLGLEFGRASGSNSVVECDLAKVEVGGSNPLSRSSLFSHKSVTPVPAVSVRVRVLKLVATASIGAVAKW